MKTTQILKYLLMILIIMIYLAYSVIIVLAQGAVSLGARCRFSHECGFNMGCRQSQLGNFKVCKITVPNAAGCAVDSGENMCADEMTCQDNRCRLTFGLSSTTGAATLSKIENVKLEDETSPSVQFFAWPNFLSIAVNQELLLAAAQKVFALILALGLLIGITWGVKGLLVFHAAVGFIPQQRRGLGLATRGLSLCLISIFCWLLFY